MSEPTPQSFAELLRDVAARSDANMRAYEKSQVEAKDRKKRLRFFANEVIRELGGAKPPDEVVEKLFNEDLSVRDAAERIRHPNRTGS